MIKTMLERLLSHLHRAVFDTSADKVTAFTLNGPAGASWVAEDENFTITFADGSVIQYDLNNFTMSQFIAQLRADGMTVSAVNSETLHFSGITMLELSGKSGPSGDPVTLYKDVLHAIFGAYSREMRAARESVDDGINQLYIPKASNGFLDVWGNMFGVPRGTDTDDDYRLKIPKEAFRLRVNRFAIEQAVKDETGYDITLDEPWRQIFRLDISRLSGADRLYGSEDPNNIALNATGYFVVQPLSFSNVDWDKVIPVIRRNLAAGVDILKPLVKGVFYVNDPLVGRIWWQNWSLYTKLVRTDQMPRLDEGLILSPLVNQNYVMQMNFDAMITSMQMLDNLPDQILGNVKFSPSRLQGFYIERGATPVLTNYTGDYKAWIKAYTSEPRKWTDGKWEISSTWRKPYEARIFTKISKFEDHFFADATSIFDDKANGHGIVLSNQIVGETWEYPQSWADDMDWTAGTEGYFPAWFDSSNHYTPIEITPHVWEMTISRAVVSLFNVRIATMTSRYSGQTYAGVTWALDGAAQASGVAVINQVANNDHTWRVNTTGTGDAIINVIGTHTVSGLQMKSQLIIHVQP